jgi:hypothetical protein
MNMRDLKSLLPGVPLVESPFFDVIAKESSPDPEALRIAKSLNEDGIAIFRFPDDQFEERAERIKARLARRFDLPAWRAGDRKEGLRVGDAWRFNPDVRAIAANTRVIEILSAVYGRKAWPFQTLNFPVGTQQHYHSDSVHFSSIPERFMCGVWVALEDISPTAADRLRLNAGGSPARAARVNPATRRATARRSPARIRTATQQ